MMLPEACLKVQLRYVRSGTHSICTQVHNILMITLVLEVCNYPLVEVILALIVAGWYLRWGSCFLLFRLIIFLILCLVSFRIISRLVISQIKYPFEIRFISSLSIFHYMPVVIEVDDAPCILLHSSLATIYQAVVGTSTIDRFSALSARDINRFLFLFLML